MLASLPRVSAWGQHGKGALRAARLHVVSEVTANALLALPHSEEGPQLPACPAPACRPGTGHGAGVSGWSHCATPGRNASPPPTGTSAPWASVVSPHVPTGPLCSTSTVRTDGHVGHVPPAARRGFCCPPLSPCHRSLRFFQQNRIQPFQEPETRTSALLLKLRSRCLARPIRSSNVTGVPGGPSVPFVRASGACQRSQATRLMCWSNTIVHASVKVLFGGDSYSDRVDVSDVDPPLQWVRASRCELKENGNWVSPPQGPSDLNCNSSLCLQPEDSGITKHPQPCESFLKSLSLSPCTHV